MKESHLNKTPILSMACNPILPLPLSKGKANHKAVGKGTARGNWLR